MKKLLIFSLLFLLPALLFAENLLQDLYDIFPKSEQLSAGTSRWVYTSVKEERFKEYAVLSSSYTYFNKSPEQIMGIERQSSFTVEISLYYSKNSSVSSDIYARLTKKGDFPVKKELSFGEKSIVKLKPISLRKMQAEYEIVIYNKNFVIEISTNDGFAVMEFGAFFDQRVKQYLYENFNIFFMERLVINVEKDGFISQKSEILSLSTDASFINISGKVIDGEGYPLEGVEVFILGESVKSLTDPEGKYNIKIPLKNNGTKVAEYVKNYVMEKKYKDNSKAETPLLMNVLLSYPSKVEKGYIFIDSGFNYGYFKNNELDNPLKNIKKDQNTLSFERDCSPKGSVFNCNQRLTLNINKDEVTGNFKGFGGLGTISGNIITKTISEVILPDQNIFKFHTISTDKDHNIISNDYKSSEILSSKETNSYVIFNYSPDKLDDKLIFAKSYKFSLNILPFQAEEKIILYLFEADIKNGYISLNPVYSISLKSSDEPLDVKFPFKDTHKTYAIGFVKEENNKKVEFISDMSIHSISPKIIVESFDISQTPDVKVIQVKNFQRDFASNSKGVKGDGKADLVFKVDSKDLKGELSLVEVHFLGKLKYSWSTSPSKILPSPVLLSSGKILNRKDGSIDKTDTGKLEDFLIFLGYPHWLDINDGDFEFTFKINDKIIKTKGVKNE